MELSISRSFHTDAFINVQFINDTWFRWLAAFWSAHYKTSANQLQTLNCLVQIVAGKRNVGMSSCVDQFKLSMLLTLFAFHNTI